MGVPQKKRATIKPKISKKMDGLVSPGSKCPNKIWVFLGGKGARAGLYSRLGPAPTMDEV